MVSSSEKLEAGVVLHETYVLETLLGTGGMGAVWKAQHVRLPRRMAIKVLHERSYQNAEILQRFRREAEITSQLGHPHIVQVFDFNILPDGRAYLVMELLPGMSLREQLDAGALPRQWVVHVLDQVSSALELAHSAGIVHRDLKPENIFMMAQAGSLPHAKVLDFGISKIQGTQTLLTQGGDLLGTPRYMSPEQARGDSSGVDGRADQFSLGAIAYELFSGRPAFTGTSITEILLRVLQENPLPLSPAQDQIPNALAQVIMRALSKDPAHRFQDMATFRAALRKAWGQPLPSVLVPSAKETSVGGVIDDLVTDDTIPRTNEDGESSPSPSSRPSAEAYRGSTHTARVAVRYLLSVLMITTVLGLGWFVRLQPQPVKVTALPSSPLQESMKVKTSSQTEPERKKNIDEPLMVSAPPVNPRPARTPNQPPPRNPVRPKPLPKQLLEATAALRRGNYDQAIRLARKGLRETSDRRAFSLLAIAYCGKKDLGAARGMMRNALPSSRGQIARRCLELGMDF